MDFAAGVLAFAYGQPAVTRDEYEKMDPFTQGFVAYMQGDWNPDVPDVNPYPQGSQAWQLWGSGSCAAAQTVEDIEDEP